MGQRGVDVAVAWCGRGCSGEASTQAGKVNGLRPQRVSMQVGAKALAIV